MENTKTAFDLIVPPIEIKTERLTVTDIFYADKEVYGKLYMDDELNKFYGYDYREDLNGNTPDADYFYRFFESLKEKKEEYSLAVRLNGLMIGEIVLYNFSAGSEKPDENSAEIGFRFFKGFQGKGYAYESVFAVIKYAFKAGFKKIVCKCFKENLSSKKLIERLAFTNARQDEKYFYYEKLS